MAESVPSRRCQIIRTANLRIGSGGGAVPSPKPGAWQSAIRRGTVAISSVRATTAKAARK